MKKIASIISGLALAFTANSQVFIWGSGGGGGGGGLSAGTNANASMYIVPGDNVDVSSSTTFTNINPYSLTTGTGFGLDATGGYMTNNSDGYYLIGFNASFGDGSSNTIQIQLHTNNVSSEVEIHRKLGTGGDVGASSASGVAWLPAGTVLNLEARNQDASALLNISNVQFYAISVLSGTNANATRLDGVLLASSDGTKTYYPASADTDAARGTALQNAQTAASSGDSIIIHSGNYYFTNFSLGKDGLSYVTLPNVTLTSNDPNDPVIEADGISFTLTGLGDVESTAVVSSNFAAINITGDSDVFISVRDIRATDSFAAAITHSGGTLTVHADSLISEKYDTIWLGDNTNDANTYIYARYLQAGTNASIHEWLEYDCSGNYSNNVYIEFDEIVRTAGAVGGNPLDEYPHIATTITAGVHNIHIRGKKSYGTNAWTIFGTETFNLVWDVDLSGPTAFSTNVPDEFYTRGHILVDSHTNPINAPSAMTVNLIGGLSTDATAWDSDITIGGTIVGSAAVDAGSGGITIATNLTNGKYVYTISDDDAGGGSTTNFITTTHNLVEAGSITTTNTMEAGTITEGGNAVYNSSETPGGELGGTWASPTIDDSLSVSGWTITDGVLSTSIQLPNGTGPTTDAAGEIAVDTDAWTRGALQIYDGTANTYAVATLASDAPSNGQVPKWNTGGTITWEDDTGSAAAVGDSGAVQFAQGSTIDGTNVFVYNRTNETLTVGAVSVPGDGSTAGSIAISEVDGTSSYTITADSTLAADKTITLSDDGMELDDIIVSNNVVMIGGLYPDSGSNLTNYTADFTYGNRYLPLTNNFHISAISNGGTFTNLLYHTLVLVNTNGSTHTVSLSPTIELSGTNYVRVPDDGYAIIALLSTGSALTNTLGSIQLFE